MDKLPKYWKVKASDMVREWAGISFVTDVIGVVKGYKSIQFWNVPSPFDTHRGNIPELTQDDFKRLVYDKWKATMQPKPKRDRIQIKRTLYHQMQQTLKDQTAHIATLNECVDLLEEQKRSAELHIEALKGDIIGLNHRAEDMSEFINEICQQNNRLDTERYVAWGAAFIAAVTAVALIVWG